jgi:hypothetical protein
MWIAYHRLNYHEILCVVSMCGIIHITCLVEGISSRQIPIDILLRYQSYYEY